MGQYYIATLADMSDPMTVDTITLAAHSWDFDNGAKLMEHSYIGNTYVGAIESALLHHPQRVVWAGDYADEEPNGGTLYDAADRVPHLDPSVTRPTGVRFVVNHDKQQIVDLDACPKDMLTIHPLPLLTAEGNGRGGGDYDDQYPGQEFIGSWARDRISVEPDDSDTTGYTVITPDFIEN